MEQEFEEGSDLGFWIPEIPTFLIPIPFLHFAPSALFCGKKFSRKGRLKPLSTTKF
jgi:hypothetical protein